MAIREIRQFGDEILTKKSRPVTEITPRIITLLDDMAETMNQAQGVGLAAPQVGVLRSVCVIDVGEGLVELINPQIVEVCEEQIIAPEGCLSLPGKYAEVSRPKKVTVAAKDRDFKDITVTGEGYMARALCHELDHLNGVFYTTHAIRFIDYDPNNPNDPYNTSTSH